MADLSRSVSVVRREDGSAEVIVRDRALCIIAVEEVSAEQLRTFVEELAPTVAVVSVEEVPEVPTDPGPDEVPAQPPATLEQ